MQPGETVLALLSGPHVATEKARNELLAVADSENGLGTVENPGVDAGASRIVYAGGAAGNDEPLAACELSSGSVTWPDLGVNAELTYLAGDQVAVLTARIENGDLRSSLALQFTSQFYFAIL